ncbi:hypothetical protein PLICRDRAFT_48991 [Plicaturopsis crispa FD-325 SS-3]|nr:hypothetical protein PLICRDRAFT_48991 [Plicaturopsis crispa FD-325 SS-3]
MALHSTQFNATLGSPPSAADLVESTAKTPSVVDEKDSIIYVEWESSDPRNPANFSYARKWVITTTGCVLTAFASSVTSAFSMGYPSMMHDLNSSNIDATLGLSMYALGGGIIPLVTAPLSEDFGRRPIYLAATFLFLLTNLAIALAPNIQSIIVYRFIAGAASSAGPMLVPGTISDIWSPEQRGLPMALMSVAGIGGQGLGPLVAGWIEMNPHLQWRWIQWIQLILIGAYLIMMPFTMQETRSLVLLTRVARELRKETGNEAYHSHAEVEHVSLWTRVWISCSRPVYLLFTEPVLWFGFAWGILYTFIESISPAFRQLHGFNQGQVGSVFITITIGSLLGFVSNIYQERLYQRKVRTKGQEARLYSACAAGIMFALSQFIYAWTAFEDVSWVGMAVGVVLFSWSIYIIYLAVSTYLADCYGPYASSALAGQSLFRNIAGTTFPLFTTTMYTRLTFKWSSTLFGCIASLMITIPFVLLRWGPEIRARSKFASHVPSFGT